MMSPFKATILALVLLGGSALAQPKQQRPPHITIAYGTQSPAQTLDLYRPAGPARMKLVVFVHGGGWIQGDKGIGWGFAKVLNAAGYAVASVNYRMIPNVLLQDEATDVASAAAFLLAHADQYGLDTSRFALAGHSAGGHLIALVATDPTYARTAGLDLRRLAAVIPLDGIFDVTQATNPHPVIGDDPKYRGFMSPTNHVGQIVGHPAFCLIHEDTARHFGQQADEFAEVLRQHGQNVTESVAPGLNHGQLLLMIVNPTQPMAGFTEDCLRKNGLS
jgi:acetyl esterase/lipase